MKNIDQKEIETKRVVCFVVTLILSIITLVRYLHTDNSFIFIIFSILLGFTISMLSSSLNHYGKNEDDSIVLFVLDHINYANTALLVAIILFFILNHFQFIEQGTSQISLVWQFRVIAFSSSLYLMSHIDWLKRGGPLLNWLNTGK